MKSLQRPIIIYHKDTINVNNVVRDSLTAVLQALALVAAKERRMPLLPHINYAAALPFRGSWSR